MESDMEDVVYSQPQNGPRTYSDSSISELSSEPADLDQYMSSVLSNQQTLNTISARSRPRRRRMALDQKLDKAIRFLRERLNWSLGEFIATFAKSSTRQNKYRLKTFKQVIFSDDQVVDQLVASNETIHL